MGVGQESLINKQTEKKTHNIIIKQKINMKVRWSLLTFPVNILVQDTGRAGNSGKGILKSNKTGAEGWKYPSLFAKITLLRKYENREGIYS